jgi:hypothetical protein
MIFFLEATLEKQAFPGSVLTLPGMPATTKTQLIFT